MERAVQQNIEEMLSEISCPKDFICYKSGLRTLCRAKDIGLDSFVACLIENPWDCKFSILFGGIFFCQCRLRVYIAKKLKK
jgi:hypothetical protein